MGKKDNPKQRVVEYFMTLHYGICHGPVDYISKITIKEKEAWSGQAKTNQAILINEPELFGGIKKEGGVIGSAYYLSGHSEQTIPEFLAAKVGLTTAEMPAYRGIASIWMSEYETGGFHEHDGRGGFYWSANTPFIPPTWIKVARTSIGLTDAIARIYRSIAIAALTGSGSGTFGNGDPDDDAPGLPGTVVNLGDDRTGNREFKWDTWGNWAAWGEHPAGFTIWDLPEGTERFITFDDGGAHNSVHITKTSKLISYTGSDVGSSPTASGGIIIFNIITGEQEQFIDLADASTFGAIGCDDIMIGSDNWVIGTSEHLSGSADSLWALKSENGEPYELEWEVTNTLGAGANNVSLGPVYGYFFRGQNADMISEVVRVQLDDGTQVAITPIDIFGFISGVHYDPYTDSVIIARTNGDLFKYSADLSTLLATNLSSSADNPMTNIGRDGLQGKRMSISPGTIAFYESSGANVLIHMFSTADLSFIRTATKSGILQTFHAYTAFNESHGLAFITAHFEDTYLYFVQGVGEFDSNPAHIIYECLTNTDWGMGSASTAIDVASFEAAASVLFSEHFGLSLQWTKQSSIESFISEIIDHIEATIYVNPRTGLITMKLIRDDYEIDSLPVYTPDNSNVTKFGRRGWGETINEIIVSFTNPENEESETVIAQDLANIVTQGGIVSDSRNYYGVRVKPLAAKLAQRDLRSAATPLATCDIEVNRKGWDLLPGEVLVLNSPEDGIASMVMRIGSIDYGKPGDPTVKASLMEDVFALAAADYIIPPDTDDDNEDEDPAPAANIYIQTIPYFLVINGVSAAILTGVDYPEVFAGIFASQAGDDSVQFELHDTNLDENIGTKSIAVRATLSDALVAEVESTILSFSGQSTGPGPEAGGFMLIGEGSEDTIELCYIESFGDLGYVITRGILDTTPKDWPVGTPVWFLNSDMAYIDSRIRSAAEEVDYKILPRTPAGLLALSDASIVTETLTERPWLPSRPANVKADGVGFGVVDCMGVNPIPVTWANRNRLTEDAVVLAWDAATVTPEAGQTINIYTTKLDGTILSTTTGLTGTSYDLDPFDFIGESQGYIVVHSEVDGLESMQGFAAQVLLSPTIDPDWSSVVLLCGFDGTDASTTLIDESNSAHVLTPVGNAQLDTAQSKFGSASLLLDGTGDYATSPDSADWDFGAGAFTIECFVRFATGFDSPASVFVSQWTSLSERAFVFNFNAGLTFTYSTDGTGAGAVSVTASWSPVIDTWYHVAVDRDGGGTIRLYVDGVMVGSAAAAVTFYNSNGLLHIGRISTSSSNDMVGWLDEIRITKGVARYGSDGGFTPPVSFYPRS